MSYLLDTNFVSELRRSKRQAEPTIRTWVSGRKPSDLYLSAITVLEVELSIARLGRRDTVQAERLQTWLEDDLLAVFGGRVLPIDLPVARRAARFHVPDPRPERAALTAATAIVHAPTMVTRNTTDFDSTGVALINPWDDLRI